MKNKYALVKVDWCDAQTTEDWEGMDMIKADKQVGATCQSVGYLVKKTDKGVVLYGTYSLNDGGEIDEMCLRIEIPKGFVVKITNLE